MSLQIYHQTFYAHSALHAYYYSKLLIKLIFIKLKDK